MKIMIIGCGYVGLVTGTCFSEMGNDVLCVDIDEKKIKNLKKGLVPIYEPGLGEMIERNLSEGRLNFTTDINKGINESKFIFIAVGTPQDENGSADLQYVLNAARDIGKKIERYTVIVNKSTVPVSTYKKVREVINEEINKRGLQVDFDIVSNPEFLKEGSAIDDFMKPDRVIIGTDSEKSTALMKDLYSPFFRKGDRIIFMDIPSSELTKYASNAMLASRITFMNELSLLCEKVGADIENVRKGIGSDVRIGNAFLFAGLGYGGSCFPKDVKALIQTSNDLNLEAKILLAVDTVNKEQRFRFIDKVVKYFDNYIKGKTFAVWGLSFKPQTDDMREAPSIDIINKLRDMGAHIQAHDPVAMGTAKAILGSKNINYVSNSYDTLKNADALLLLTEWHQFRKPDFDKIKSLLKNPVIFDGRNQYDPSVMKEKGFVYHCIGRNIL
ncbi:MAG: UDP-glucose/GDP-mannose dehydrogenase family protein [Spirochaetes bacterium]|nr:UDP-glucose/GDP-mannose dehydrogenase family protein [Spirochaetota bacterium]